MASTKVHSSTRGQDSSSSGQTADVLKKRLATAEEDTQQLMRQLEEMGFNPKTGKKEVSSGGTEKTSSENTAAKKSSSVDDHQPSYPSLKSQTKKTESSDELASSNGSNRNSAVHSSNSDKGASKSSKHRPITPLSLRGLVMPGALEGIDTTKTYDGHVVKSSRPRSSDGGARRKQTSDGLDEKPVGRHGLEEELIRVKRLLSQTEEDLQYESQGKLKAREELEKMKAFVEEITTARTESELKVEELNATKQKLLRRTSELKDEVARESSLRSSLEESHATLLVRLQDMESVIETQRSEAKTHSAGHTELKAEVLKLKDELAAEAARRQRVEENYHILITEKDKLVMTTTSAQAENNQMSHELNRLQTQYKELIQQLQQTQTLVDNLNSTKASLEEERNSLSSQLIALRADYDTLKAVHGDTKESENRLAAEKLALEEDFCKVRSDRDKLAHEIAAKKRKIDSLERELNSVKQSLAQKNQEFSSAADCLELELAALKGQLESMENEKQHVLKDKESLLEEVNQTVDTLMSERSRLQTELQASCVEAESLRSTCSRLEQDKAQLLERLGGLQHHQNTQIKIEEALNEMMEQKNKLAYENGKLQSTITQLRQELDDVTREQGDIAQLRKLSQSLQMKYTLSQQELSEYKINLQRSEGQARAAMEELEKRELDLRAAVSRREEMEKEMDRVLGQLQVLEGRQLYKVTNYEKNMEEAKSVNKEIAGTLEAVMASHTQLQNIVENLQVELGKRDSQLSQVKASRARDQEEMKAELKAYEERVENLHQQLKKEKEKSGKKATRDLTEMRKQADNLSSRNQELVRLNTELRQRLADGEKEKEELRAKMQSQRHKLEYLHKAKKQLEDNLSKMKAVREDIEELEQMRDEYMKKNLEQGETITKFINQITGLQEEMRQLAQAHTSTQTLLKLKEEALDKERRIQAEMRKRYTDTKKREVELSKKSHVSDEKLQEVHSESLEISRHLQEAHDWFKGKFDKLQTELSASKQIQAKLEKDNQDQRRSLEDERSKAQDAAERAKEMIQTSRQTISRLADYAELADADTKQQLARLRTGVGSPLTS